METPVEGAEGKGTPGLVSNVLTQSHAIGVLAQPDNGKEHEFFEAHRACLLLRNAATYIFAYGEDIAQSTLMQGPRSRLSFSAGDDGPEGRPQPCRLREKREFLQRRAVGPVAVEPERAQVGGPVTSVVPAGSGLAVFVKRYELRSGDELVGVELAEKVVDLVKDQAGDALVEGLGTT
jgi:hypothetical protein